MSKPADPARRPARLAALAGLSLAAVAGLLVQAPGLATAGAVATTTATPSAQAPTAAPTVVAALDTRAAAATPARGASSKPGNGRIPEGDDEAPAAGSVPGAPPTKAGGGYRLRCWQYGRLIFDEGPIVVGPEAKQGARLVASDRNGQPLLLTDGGGGATCLVGAR